MIIYGNISTLFDDWTEILMYNFRKTKNILLSMLHRLVLADRRSARLLTAAQYALRVGPHFMPTSNVAGS
jgi:hypothetical protein